MAGARMAGSDKEFDRLVPAIFVEDGRVPRFHVVLERVVESMAAVSQLVPIIVAADDNVFLDGVTRLDALKRRGLTLDKVGKVKDIDAFGQVVPRNASNAGGYRASFTELEAMALSNRCRLQSHSESPAGGDDS